MKNELKRFAIVALILLSTACGGPVDNDTPPPAGVGSTETPNPGPLTVTISTPTRSNSYSTDSGTLNVSGVASDGIGVTQVSWSNDRGGSGVAVGTTTWSVTGIALQTGVNIITVTARNAAGNTAADTLTVSFAPSAVLDCTGATVLCVDDSPGTNQEYSTIQQAVDAARGGDTVLVHDGSYRGFVVTASGTPTSRIVVKAAGGAAVIDRVNGSNEGITLSNASYVTVEGFTVTGLPGYGLATHNASAANPIRGLIIRNNTVQNSGSSNIYLSQVADSLVEGNSATGSAASHGIYLANGGSDNTILRGNRCYNNGVNGIHFNGDWTVGGDGLHSGLTVEGNIVYNNGANGIDADGVQDSLFQNNLVYGNGRNALRAFKIDSAQGPKNLKVVNNTLLVPAGAGWALKLSEDLGGHTFFNNILLSDNAGTGSISVPNRNFVSNNNAVVGRLSYDGENSIVPLSAWQAAGYDLNSFMTTAADLFVNRAAANYQLKSGAPAIDAGLPSLNSIQAPATDLVGRVRPQGVAVDLGAYESF